MPIVTFRHAAVVSKKFFIFMSTSVGEGSLAANWWKIEYITLADFRYNFIRKELAQFVESRTFATKLEEALQSLS